MAPIRIIRKKIGELLIERKIISDEQLEHALQVQKENGGYLSQHLIDLGFTSESDIARCLSSQYGFPYLPLDNYSIPPEVLEIIPFKLIKIYSVLPIDKVGQVLTVAMADPLNDGLIEMLKQITNCNIEIFISTYSDITLTLERYFKDKLKEAGVDAFAEEDKIKEDIVRSFIQMKGYSGDERRRCRRFEVDLEMSYFFQGKTFKAKIKNMSHVGIYFITESFVPIDADILSKIDIEGVYINVPVKVVRAEKIKQIPLTGFRETDIMHYGIAGFFKFITDDDKERLSLFFQNVSGSNKQEI